MRILVWGAFPAAGWIAGRLHQLQHETWWLADEPTVTDVLQFGSVQLRSPQRDLRIQGLHVSHHIDEILKPPLDWIILAIPTWAVGDAVREMSRRIPPEHCPPIFVLSNGIGAFEKIETYFPAEKIVQGFPTRQFVWPQISNGTVAREVVVSDGVGGVALTQGQHSEKLAQLLRVIGMGDVLIHARESLQWSDVLWQIQCNALPTLLQVSPEAVYQSPELFALEYRQLREAMAVIDYKKVALVDLPGVDVRRLGWQIRLLPEQWLAPYLQKNRPQPTLITGLQQKHGRSDAAYLNGAVARTAYELKIAAPVNHTFAVSITDVAEGRAAWQQFSPEYLQTLVRIASRV